MLRKLLMPKLGLTMTEGQVAEWMVAVGAPFKLDGGLFVVETDKVATEVSAEADGVLTKIIVETGQTVPVGEVIAYWQDTTEAGAAEEVEPDPEAVDGAVDPMLPIPSAVQASTVASSRAVAPAAGNTMRVPVTPLARRLAQQLAVDLATVTGSGPRKRIKAADVRNAAAATPAVVTQAAAVAQSVAPAKGEIDPGIRSKPSSVQSAMARRLTAVKQEVPHFYLAVEAQVSSLLKLRSEINALNGAVRLTLNHFVVAAIGRALHDLPEMNRLWSNGDIVSFTSTDVGVAVTTERGLLVPVVRDVGRVSLIEVARRTQSQVERARSGALTSDDMAGGAITVSNAGMFNVKFMTPIINPGQAMILGVGSISQVFRPDAEGRPALRDEMGLVLAADHRILDGVAGLSFLNRIVAYLEHPIKLLVGD